MFFIMLIALIFVISSIYVFTNSLGFLGFLIIIVYFSLTTFFVYKHYKGKDLYEEPVVKFCIIIFAIVFIPLLFGEFVVQIGLNNEKYEELNESYSEGNYEDVISSVNTLRSIDWSFSRADRLEEKAIDQWITECKRDNESTCKEDIFESSVIHSNLETEAIKAFGFDKSEYLSKRDEEEGNRKYKEAREASEPFIGMEEKYISSTGWGAPDEENVNFDDTANTMLKTSRRNKSVSYYWYHCEGNKQYTNEVEVYNSEVSDVNVNIGIDIDQILPHHRKCSK